jgi:hypothetical protein
MSDSRTPGHRAPRLSSPFQEERRSGSGSARIIKARPPHAVEPSARPLKGGSREGVISVAGRREREHRKAERF